MKRFVLILLCSSAIAAPSPTPKPFDPGAVDFSKISKEDIEKTIKHRNELLAQQDKTLSDQSDTIANQARALKDAAEANKATTDSFRAYQMATEATIDKANKAIAALDHVLKKLHLAKWIMCGLWVAAVAFLAMKLPPPLSLYVGGGAAVAGIAVIWMWL